MGALEDGQPVEQMEAAMTTDLEQVVDSCASDCGSGSGSESEANNDKSIEDAVRILLQGLGEDPDRQGIIKTPIRVAKAFKDGTKGYRQNAIDIVENALFSETKSSGSSGLVVVRDINLFSYCESCLLPFSIQCHIGYVPSMHRVVGLSKLSRVADVFAKRLQSPQRLAHEICSALHSTINPDGVAVALQCWHIQYPESLKCNTHPSKSSMQGWIRTSVCSSSGILKTDKKGSFWDEFITLLKFRGVHTDVDTSLQSWCPSTCKKHQLNGELSAKSSMVSAVENIIELLGEDLLRKELIHTPFNYVNWLLNFRRSILEPKQNGYNLGRTSLHKRETGVHSELNMPFCSLCEHHLLPFYGVVHVGYFDTEENGKTNVIERSFLESLVNFYGCKLQVQERLTRQIAEIVHSIVSKGVMVVVEANHICMISRGIEKMGSSTATIAVMGHFSTDFEAKAFFFQNISNSTASGG